MNSTFIQSQWEDLCHRLDRTARHQAGGDDQRREQFELEAKQFAQLSPPESYADYLERVKRAAAIAINWQARHATTSPDTAHSTQKPSHEADVSSSDAPNSSGSGNSAQSSKHLDPVTEAGDESFPASDPPSWSPSSL